MFDICPVLLALLVVCQGKIVKDKFSEHGYATTGNEIAYLILGIFGLGIVSMAILQNDFNSLPLLSSESTQPIQRRAIFYNLQAGIDRKRDRLHVVSADGHR